MSVSPINITRVSHNFRTMSMLETLRRNTVDIFTQQNRLATGRRFTTPSDDPVAASQSLKMNDSLRRQDQILSNLRQADLLMSTADEALTEVNGLLNQAEAIASQSIGAQTNSGERRANAAVIASIHERLMVVGNRELRGSFIFAGRATQTAPFASALGGVVYLGDTGDRLARVGLFEQEPTNVPGNVVFGALSTSVGADADLRPALTADTRLTDLAGANSQGIRKGTVVISDTPGNSLQIDLSSADTVGDVIDMINGGAESAGISVTVDIQGNGLMIASGSATIRDTATGGTASDLGLEAHGLQSVGSPDLGPRVTPNTLLASLNGGSGLDLETGFKITNGNRTVEIDLSDAVTIQDITNRINAAGIFVTAKVNQAGTGIEIVSQVSGANMSISDDGGSAAQALGIRTMNASTPLSSLNFGRGVEILEGKSDLLISTRAGTSFEVNLDGAETVGDVAALITQAAADAGINVTAAMSETANGIVIKDETGGTGTLSVNRANIDAFAVDDLGLLKTVADPDSDLLSDDVGAVRADGVFTALIELERALLADDERALGEISERLVEFGEEITRVHGVIGARAQGFRARVEQTENAVVATRTFLSEIEDLDYTEAVTRFQQAQTALQANLLSGSQLLNLSLLDFLA
ncbi:MAG: flagellin [Phycisphaerae bacterium]